MQQPLSTSPIGPHVHVLKFAQDLKEEEERHLRKGLTEDELEIYDR